MYITQNIDLVNVYISFQYFPMRPTINEIQGDIPFLILRRKLVFK